MSRWDPEEWRGLVVVCGGSRWDGIVSPERQVALQLARTVPVLFVDPPASVVRLRNRLSVAGRVRREADRIAVLTPVVQPGVDRPGIRVVTEWLVRAQLRRAARALGGDVQAVFNANQRNLLGVCNERVRAVYATDDFTVASELFEVRRDVLVRQQERLAANADVAICVSEPIAAAWRALGVDAHVIPNGCDVDAGAAVDDVAPADDVHLPPPVAGFLGYLSPRIDLRLLRAVADRGVSLLLVGPVSAGLEFDDLVARPNVQWLGQRPPSTMPSYLRVMDVGLTPYVHSDFNRASYPLKTLEYLAAGRPVVATSLPATRSLGTEHVTIADDPVEFADAVATAAALPKTPELLASRRAFARRHSWEARVAEIAPLLGVAAR